MELKRLLNKKTIGLLAMLTLISCLIFYKEQINKSDSLIYGENAKDSTEDINYDLFDIMDYYKELIFCYKQISAQLPEIDSKTLVYSIRRQKYGAFDKETESRYIFLYAIEMFESYIDYVTHYGEWVDGVLVNAENMLKIPVFNKPGFSYNNILKSRYDYKKMIGLTPQVEDNTTFESVFSYDTIHYMLIIMIVFTVVSFGEQRKKGLWSLVYSTEGGRGKLMSRRVAALFFLSLFYTIFMYLALIGTAIFIYGGIDGINVSLQSSEMFSASTLHMTQGQFMVYYIVYVAVAAVVIGTLTWFFITIFRNITAGYICVAALAGVEALLYQLDTMSRFSIFYFVNIFHLLNPINLFTRYSNWGTESIILGSRDINLIFMLLLFGGLLIGIFFCENRMYPFTATAGKNKGLIWISRCLYRLQARLPMLCKEMYKLLFTQRGLIILLIYGLLISKSVFVGNMYYDEKGGILRDYYMSIEGMEWDEIREKIDEYHQLQKEYQANYDKMSQIFEDGGSVNAMVYGEMGQKASLYAEVAEIMEEQFERVQDFNERGINADIINEKEYNEIFGKRLTFTQRTVSLYAVMAIIFLLFGVFSYDKKQGLITLIRTSSEGRKKHFHRKLLLVALVVAAVYCVAYIPNLIQTMKVYDFNNLSSSVKSLKLMEKFPLDVSIGGFLGICYLVRFLMLYAVGLWVMAVSVETGYLKSMLISFVILLPQLLYMVGIEFFASAAWIESLNVPYFLQINQFNWYGYCIYLLVFIIGIVSYIVCRRKWEGKNI